MCHCYTRTLDFTSRADPPDSPAFRRHRVAHWPRSISSDQCETHVAAVIGGQWPRVSDTTTRDHVLIGAHFTHVLSQTVENGPSRNRITVADAFGCVFRPCVQSIPFGWKTIFLFPCRKKLIDFGINTRAYHVCVCARALWFLFEKKKTTLIHYDNNNDMMPHK